MNNPFSLFDQTREAYLRYLDSPFRLRYDALMEERRALLDSDRQLYRAPLFEPLPPYRSSGRSVVQAAQELGAPAEAGEFLRQRLFEPLPNGQERELYEHQFQAWQASRQGRAVVVTSGTGSGKTECYLVPLFASLVEEAVREWKTPCPVPPAEFWWNGNKGRKPQREFENQTRPAALRALLMYPLNALIEDQLGRIREASDSAAPRQWLRNTLNGHRLWFGRYNGDTPVSGSSQAAAAYQEFRGRMKRMEEEWRAAELSATSDPRILSFFQDPSGAEMWGRWDMQETPPDILITNYSMLNIMLMRDIESPIFEATKAWLQASKEHVFHLIVDELHTYRGTAGTEVAYLMRAFLHRIGLQPDSPQLRIIATSASIENDSESLRYLEGFFGRERSGFEIFSGSPRDYGPPPVGLTLAPLASSFAAFGEQVELDPAGAADALRAAVGGTPTTSTAPELKLNEALTASRALEAVRQSSTRPKTTDELAESLFAAASGPNGTPALSAEQQEAAVRGLLRAMVLARQPDGGGAPLPIRAHYFFHNAGRLWACVDPECSECSGRTGLSGAQKPPVGRIYTEPRPRCGCGARVLELLYCEPCGEVFLGGYQRAEGSNVWNLTPDFSDLERVPDRASSLSRTYGEYRVFWPSRGDRPIKDDKPEWEWQSGGGAFAWRTAHLKSSMGQVRLKWSGAGAGDIKGYLYEAPEDSCAGLPHRCPQCGEDWARRRGVKSPVRDLGSGFSRVVQLLTDSMLRQMPDVGERKLVLFSDSRQDAAKLSTGIKRAHYLDTLRQTTFRRLNEAAESAQAQFLQKQQVYTTAQQLLQIEVELLQGSPIDKPLRKLLNENLKTSEDGRKALAQIPTFASELEDDPAAVAPIELQPPATPPDWTALRFDELLDFASRQLVALGMNPGGPQPSVAIYRPPVPKGQKAEVSLWENLVDWNAVPPEFTQFPDKSDPRAIHIGLIRASLRASLLQDVLFAPGSRDFESLKLGLLWVRTMPPQDEDEEIAAGVLRLLARRRRFAFRPGVEGKLNPPEYVTAYLRAVEAKSGATGIVLNQRLNTRVRAVKDFFGAALNQWIVQPTALYALAPRPGKDGCVAVYNCSRCGRAHLHQAGGICIVCRRPLPQSPRRERVVGQPTDYYEFLARSDEPEFRLNCQELTGQTDAAKRRLRQRLFQEVFMGGESPQADGVDLLSVTTTMEAGVDIGALQGIGMANMPPVRFNYQQRVGRAGRRGRGMSAALTLCRGRSHDDYYFERPQLITSEAPPKPYVDMERESIARRVVNKEILRRAFSGRPIPVDESERGGDNVHGEFGSVAAWFSTSRVWVEDWISSPANTGTIREVCEAVLRRALPSKPVSEMEDWIRNELSACINEKASLSGPQESSSLSKRLASHGVLPMFGFPTQVRLLHHNWPSARGTSDTVDRDLDIAISQFAPGAQTVKDDQLLTAFGVVEYERTPLGFDEVPDPLRDPVQVGVCRRCQALVTPPAPGPCPICSTAPGEDGYTVIEANEPPGFCTIYAHEAEFEGGFEFAPRALRARLGTQPNAPQDVGNAVIDALEQARVYRINDYGGKGFPFRKMQRSHVWFVEAAADQSLKTLPDADQKTAFMPKPDENAPTLSRALAAISTTDVMTVGLREVPVGLSLNPARDEAKAAWYSFGFLLRRAASVSLDISEGEIDMGLQPFKDYSVPFEPPSARIFLSDKLQNGAGYSTYFRDPTRFQNLLRLMLGQPPVGAQSQQEPGRFYDPMVAPDHRDECASSCHRCLREFGNMAYHALLDWRLALDMTRLALAPNAPIDLEQPLWKPLLEAQAPALFDGFSLQDTQFGTLRAGVDSVTDEAFLLVHPLWDTFPANYGPQLAEAAAEAEAAGLKPRPWSLFRAVRFPFETPKPSTT